MSLDGPNAFIADAGHTNSNSALTTLAEVDGEFSLSNGATDAITGDVYVPGRIDVDSGSRLYISGKLSNDSSSNGVIAVDSNGEKTVLGVGSFRNVPTSGFPARLFVSGGSTATDQAIMYIGSGAGFGQTGIVDGLVQVSGNAFIHFKSGEITQIAADGNLSLDGADAFLASDSSTTSNSALTGLTYVRGNLSLSDGQSVATTAGINNSGSLQLDTGGAGGSSLDIAAKLTNTGGLGIGNGQATAKSAVDVGGSLVNTGTIRLASTTGSRATLDVTGVTSGKHGAIDVGSDTTVDLAGGVTGQTFNYDGTSDLIQVGHAYRSSFNVAGFAAGDTLDLRGEVVTKLSYNGSVLTLTISNGATRTINFTGSFDGLTHTSDGAGGTYIKATSAAEAPEAMAASEPGIFARHADLAQSAAMGGGGSDVVDGALHARFAEMMAHALDGGSGAMTSSLHEAAGSGAHAASLFAAALHGH